MNSRTSSRFVVSAAATVLALSAMVGCSSTPTNSQIGTATGAVLGGVVGSAVLGGPVGTLGGAAAGAVIGNEVGKKY